MTHHMHKTLLATYTQLGSLQIAQHGNGVGVLLLHLPDHHEQLLLLLLRSVAEIQPEDVGPGKKERLDHLHRRGRRAERGQLLGALAPPLGDLGGGGDGGLLLREGLGRGDVVGVRDLGRRGGFEGGRCEGGRAANAANHPGREGGDVLAAEGSQESDDFHARGRDLHDCKYRWSNSEIMSSSGQREDNSNWILKIRREEATTPQRSQTWHFHTNHVASLLDTLRAGRRRQHARVVRGVWCVCCRRGKSSQSIFEVPVSFV